MNEVTKSDAVRYQAFNCSIEGLKGVIRAWISDRLSAGVVPITPETSEVAHHICGKLILII